MNVILAIDQGTTGSRSLLINHQGRIVASAYQEFPQYFPAPGWVEHDPEEIWTSVAQTIQAVRCQAPKASISAIGITNQRETTVLWDAQTGRPVHRAIVWQCRRTADRCRQFNQEPGLPAMVRRRTGLPVDAYFSATKIEWLLNHVPEARRLARQGRLRFGTTDAWLVWKLTGGQVHATDYTNASRTLIFNIHRRAWDEDLLRLFRIPPSLLPAVHASAGEVGRTIRIGRLGSGIPIAGLAGDQQAALFGQACFDPGTLKNTYGTGCFILLNTGARKPSSRHGLITTLGCDGRGQPVYVLEGSIFVAGAAIQWLRDGLGLLANARESDALASALPDNGGVYFVPALVGLGAPYWDSDVRGALVGLTRGTQRGHVVRAALEAMAYATRDVLDAMIQDSGLRLKNLRVDGGATANRFLCQFQSNLLRLPVVRPKILESTALGAAYLAGLGTGFWSDSAALARLGRTDRVFLPQGSRAEANALYTRWHSAVASARAFT